MTTKKFDMQIVRSGKYQDGGISLRDVDTKEIACVFDSNSVYIAKDCICQRVIQEEIGFLLRNFQNYYNHLSVTGAVFTVTL